jgi:serine/threonine protein kinase
VPRLLTVTFRGTCLSSGRHVAVKLLRTRQRDVKARFVREINTLETLKCFPNSIAILTSGNWNDLLYHVTLWLDGPSLETVIAGRVRLPNKSKLAIALRVTQIVRALHARNIVHRDISPDHIFFVPDGDICLIDFGMAEILDWEFKSRAQERIGHDISSLGLVFCELMLGSSIFDYGRSHLRRQVPRALVEINKTKLSKAIQNTLVSSVIACTRAMVQLPAGLHAYQSMRELEEELTDCFLA